MRRRPACRAVMYTRWRAVVIAVSTRKAARPGGSGLAVAVGRVVFVEPAPTDGPEIFVGRRVPLRGEDGDADDQEAEQAGAGPQDDMHGGACIIPPDWPGRRGSS